MNQSVLDLKLVVESKDIPYDILLLADPSRVQIQSYLKNGTCYVAKLSSEIIGAFVLHPLNKKTMEIKNIAIVESQQGKGFGKNLLNQAEELCRKQGFIKVVIATGNSSIGQLALYQKLGFEIDRIEKDYFTQNYAETIFENGIQCKHKIILEKILHE